jgi:aspartyl-tRNA(Asn)/glutamyl-tRNA(Gln) amidotransferase subunit C
MVTKDDIKRISQLARLDIEDADIATINKFKNDLLSIIEYVKMLDEVDTEDMDSFFMANDNTSVLREDNVVESLDHNDVILNAINTKDGYIKVEKVL